MSHEPRDELLPLRFHLRGNLLAHGFPERVCFKPGKSGKVDGDEKHVVLIRHDAIGTVEYLLESRVEIAHQLRVFLALDIRGYGFHRTRPVERDHGIDVVDRGRPELLQKSRHAGTVQLERPFGFAARKHLERLRIVERNVLDVDRDSVRRSDALD